MKLLRNDANLMLHDSRTDDDQRGAGRNVGARQLGRLHARSPFDALHLSNVDVCLINRIVA